MLRDIFTGLARSIRSCFDNFLRLGVDLCRGVDKVELFSFFADDLLLWEPLRFLLAEDCLFENLTFLSSDVCVLTLVFLLFLAYDVYLVLNFCSTLYGYGEFSN